MNVYSTQRSKVRKGYDSYISSEDEGNVRSSNQLLSFNDNLSGYALNSCWMCIKDAYIDGHCLELGGSPAQSLSGLSLTCNSIDKVCERRWVKGAKNRGLARIFRAQGVIERTVDLKIRACPPFFAPFTHRRVAQRKSNLSTYTRGIDSGVAPSYSV